MHQIIHHDIHGVNEKPRDRWQTENQQDYQGNPFHGLNGSILQFRVGFEGGARPITMSRGRLVNGAPIMDVAVKRIRPLQCACKLIGDKGDLLGLVDESAQCHAIMNARQIGDNGAGFREGWGGSAHKLNPFSKS